jgi:tetratricopeptide (TPR) repeat protein
MAVASPGDPSESPPVRPSHWAAVSRWLRDVWVRVRRHPVQNFTVISLVLVSVVAMAMALAALSPEVQTVPAAATVQDVLAALDQQRFDDARQLALDLRRNSWSEPAVVSTTAFVLGVVTAHDAAAQPNEHERRVFYLLAARYLEECRKREPPAGRQGICDLELGRCWFECGRYAEAVHDLEAALASCPEQAAEICERLAVAHMRTPAPNPQAALRYSQQFLADPKLAVSRRQDALLQQARILLDMGDADRARECLRQIPKDHPDYVDVMLLSGQLLLVEGDQLARAAEQDGSQLAAAQEKFATACQELKKAQSWPDLNSVATRRVHLLLGLARRRLGDDPGALAEFSLVGRAGYATPEGLAAGLEEAELQTKSGNVDAALEACHHVVQQVGSVHVFSNPWLALPDLKQRLEILCQLWRKAGRFESGVELARTARGILGDERSVELQIEAEVAWAQRLTQLAETRSQAERAALLADARAAWRRAGDARRDLARLRFATHAYPDALWAAAEDYRRGNAYPTAIRVLQKYMDHAERQKTPPALAALGACHLALNQPDTALKYLLECVEFHADDPYCYRARIAAADAYVELGKWDEAKAMLRQNLDQESLTPRSIEWRESLNRLGHILYQEGLEHEMQARLNGLHSSEPSVRNKGLKDLELAHAAFAEAERRLRESVNRVTPQSAEDLAEQTMQTRYLVAEAHRRLAVLPQMKSADVAIDSLRAALNRQVQQERNSALEHYSDLEKRLNDKQETIELSDLEQRILRNCYFAQADTLSDLGRYEEAVRAFQAATSRYQREPECLQAYLQIANCLRRLNRAPEARGTLEQAKVVLRQIPAAADFTRTTCHDRDEWTKVLEWLSTL